MKQARNVVLLAFLCLAAATAQAQEWRGPASIALDVKGKPHGNVAGALVILRYQQTEPPSGPRPVLTDSAGRAVLVDLAEGVWEVEVSHADFLSFVALVFLDSRRKPEVQASFLQASGSSLTPIKVKFMDGNGKSPSASVPLPPEAAERLAQRRPPRPTRRPAETTAQAPSRRAPAPPQTVMPEPELRPLPEAARPVETPSPPAPADAVAEPDAQAPEPTAPPTPEPATTAEPEPVAPAAEPAPVLPQPAVVPRPEPAAPAEPAKPMSEPTVPEPLPAPTMPEPTPAPSEPEPAPAAPEPAPPMPEPAPPMPEPAPPIPEPEPIKPEPVAPPEPAPAPAMPEPTAPPEPEPQPAAPPKAAPEPVPVQPEPRPAPTPATALPPPGPLGPTLRAYRDRTCIECRPGEWAISVETVVGPASGPCADSLEAEGRELADLLGSSVTLELKEVAAPADRALEQMVSAEPSARVAELLGDDSRSCRIVAAVIPKAGRFRGLRMEAADATGVGDCQADRPCPVGRARWIGQPRVAREPSANVIWGLFVNEAPDRARRARLTVYFAAPNRAWDPPR